jgi:uncharacterized protein (TIGR03437 family)
LAQTAPDWRKVGSSSVELGLASPATGPVAEVWYAPDGAALYARTAAGNTFQTNDFETWKDAGAVALPPAPLNAAVVRMPEAGATVVASVGGRVFALGRQLWRSDDEGHSWTNLTAFQSQSIVGPGQRSIAVSPADPDQLALANDYGVWRSLDGGLTWSGLNQSLPNLDVRRILSTAGGAGTRVFAAGLGGLELAPGSTVWQPAPGVTLLNEDALKSRYSTLTGAQITAVASAGDTVYIGSSDGRLWVSGDGGQSFQSTPPPQGTSGRVERIFVDATAPRVALAALSGGGPHVLRTTNNGTFWDALDFNLPNAPVYSVTADRAGGAVYVASQKGVFYGHTDLNNATADPVNWENLSGKLPAARATDVRLDPAGIQLYAALEGYGVYAAAAPHVLRSMRLVNAADFSGRPAAPGSLVSVIGGRISGAMGSSLNYPVLAASDTESQIQVPFEAVGPNVALALQTPTGSVTMGLAVQPLSPAILVSRDGTPAVFDADTELPVDGRNPAQSGGRLKIMLTGLGKVRPDWPTGLQAPMNNPPAVTAPVKAYLDGEPIQVSSATLASGYIGFYVVEVQLPAVTNTGTSELYLSAEGHDSNKIQIVIEP